jgi:hypothetical protein
MRSDEPPQFAACAHPAVRISPVKPSVGKPVVSGYPFTHFDLGYQKRGATVVVTLRGNRANLRLMDSSNFSNYRRGAQHRFVGGQAQQSPVRLAVPNDGQWHLVVDLIGLAGQVNTSIVVEPPPPAPLQPIRMTSSALPPLQRIVENVAAIAPESPAVGKAYDVFISHATEDKDAVVRDLAHALRDLGVEVWYDEFALRIGDNLRRKIDAGLGSSRFGVVVLSPRFFAKNWSQYELDGLVVREMSGERQIILPIWHDVSREEVETQSPSLAGRLALRTSENTIEEIAAQIAEVVGTESAPRMASN